VQYIKQRATSTPEQATELGGHMATLLMEAGAESILREVSRHRD
jgi:hypothetical protein